MFRDIKRLYLVDSLGNTTRIKCIYNGEKFALDLLQKACPDRQCVTVEYPDPKYPGLKESIALVGDFSRSGPLRTLHQRVSALKGIVADHVWVVMIHCDGDRSGSLGAYQCHGKAMAAAEAYDAQHADDEDIYATLELVRYHE